MEPIPLLRHVLACVLSVTHGRDLSVTKHAGRDATSCLYATGLVRAQDVVVANSGAHENDEAAISQ